MYLSAGIGSIFTSSKTNGEWYKSIRPSITPPGWVFPIVWNILFLLMALSLYSSWTKTKDNALRSKIFSFFGINLCLNILWSLFYFQLQSPLLAFFDLILLWASILVLIFLSWKKNRKASLLLIPYLVWVSFAAVLNFLSI
jgi:tryptophan-rich sensory protein